MIMKRTLRLLLTVGLSLVCVSLFAQKFPNYPIPQQPDTLRISASATASPTTA